jgi:hypothetical protein
MMDNLKLIMVTAGVTNHHRRHAGRQWRPGVRPMASSLPNLLRPGASTAAAAGPAGRGPPGAAVSGLILTAAAGPSGLTLRACPNPHCSSRRPPAAMVRAGRRPAAAIFLYGRSVAVTD